MRGFGATSVVNLCSAGLLLIGLILLAFAILRVLAGGPGGK